ncbi:MAG: GNAT family N-acetyltransferase [Planctomycetes bacterium]|nr:GNAT family N-acetyltransferase [Planctomycetota bacterium]
MPSPSLTLQALSEATLPLFGALLAERGFGGCFCAVWTAHGSDWAQRCSNPAKPNLDETTRRVLAGEHVGFLVWEGEESTRRLVAWTGAGPKTGFPLMARKLGSRLTPTSHEVWSIGCLAIASKHRGQGLSKRVVLALVDEATRHGASALEAYPTDPWDEPRSYRGAQSTFAEVGFQVVARDPDEDAEILVMRLELSS